MKRKIFSLALTLILFLAFASPAFAQGSDGDQFIFGSSRTLEDGEVIAGDLIVFGGNVNITKTSKVDGDLVVIGGNADVDGTVTGSVEVLGGNVDLNETAIVEGDVNVVGGNVSRAEGVQIKGNVESMTDFGGKDDAGEWHDFGPPSFADRPALPNASGFFGYLFWAIEDTFWDISWIIGLALIGWLVAAFLPEQMQVVGDAAAQAPVVSFGMGLLTAILGTIVAIILTLTICLTIISAPLVILLIMGALLGWIVIGQIIGERLLTSIERPLPNFVITTVVGVAVLTALSKMPVIGVIPIAGWVLGFLGFLFGLIVMFVGLGAVVLTRYGTRPYPANGDFGSGSMAYHPYTPPPPQRGGSDPLSRSEAELKAKIKAALAEAEPSTEESEPDEPSSGQEQPAEEKPKPKKPSAKKKSPKQTDGAPSGEDRPDKA